MDVWAKQGADTRFEAELGFRGSRVGKLFFTGLVCAYEIERIREAAAYGVDNVQVRLFGTNAALARKQVQGLLNRLERRGVTVSVLRG